ncbi:MAG: SocA family protein [Rhodospirillales bacterium]|nr:SocA family protein [Rhodospirillales bacterium]
MPHDALATANKLLDLADARDLQITHMGLHKVLYFAHGWHLAAHGGPLIDQPFAAWKHGPVLRPVWEAFKAAQRAPIRSRGKKFDPVNRVWSPAREPFSAEDERLLGAVLAGYGHLDAIALSRMTHRSGGAWDRVWNAPAGRINVGMTIPDALILEDFRTVPSMGVAGRS